MKLSRTSSREAFMVEGLSPYVTVFLVYRGPHRPHLDHLRHIECILVLSTLILLTPFHHCRVSSTRVGNRSGNSRRLTDHRTGILLPGSDWIEIGAAPAGNRCLNRSGLSTLKSRPISGIFLLCNGKHYF